MKDTKIITLLALLSNDELKRFHLFVESPYFNTSPTVSKLAKFLLKYAPGFESKNCNYEAAYKAMYGSKKSTDKRALLAKPLSQLFGLAKTFAALEENNNSPLNQHLQLMEYLNKKGSPNMIEEIHDSAQKLLLDQVYLSTEYYWNTHKIRYEWAYYLNSTQTAPLQQTKFQDVLEPLEIQFFLGKIKILCAISNQSGYNNVIVERDKYNDWVEQHSTVLILQNPVAHVWVMAWHLLYAPNTEHYYTLKGALKHTPNMQPKDVRTLYSYVCNIARHIFTERKAHMAAMFDNFQEMIKKDVLLVNGHLSLVMLRNITIVALHLGQYEWAKKFLDEHRDKTRQEDDDVVSLCYAFLHFEKNETEECLSLLLNLQSVNILTKLDERRLRLLCYLRLGHHSLFMDLVNSFRKFLSTNQNKLVETHVITNRSFLSIIQELHIAIQSNDKTAISNAIDNLVKSPNLPFQEWMVGIANHHLSPIQ